MKNHYQILGLPSRLVSPDEIKRAYRRLADEFAYNPDYQKAIGEAYADLIDPQKRAAYDARLQSAEVAEAIRSAEGRAISGGRWRWLGLISLAVLIAGYYHASRPKVLPPEQPARIAVDDASQEKASVTSSDAQSSIELPSVQPTVSPSRSVDERAVIQQPVRETRVHYVRPEKKKGFDASYLAWTTYLVVGSKSRGSGVMVAPDKILTNCHVVAGNAMSGLIVINSATRERAKVDKYSKLEDDEDVCLLNVPGAPAYVAEWGRSELLEAGAVTHTVSFPGNEGLTWSSGNLVRREAPLGMEVLVTTNYCRPGVSGGPLFDDMGLLIGVTSAGRIYRSGGSECLSLTAETAKRVLYKPMVPIALAPSVYEPAMLRR